MIETVDCRWQQKLFLEWPVINLATRSLHKSLIQERVSPGHGIREQEQLSVGCPVSSVRRQIAYGPPLKPLWTVL